MSDVTTISTHVLDTSLGKPAAGITVWLERASERGMYAQLTMAETNADGRAVMHATEQGPLEGGSYRLRFEVAAYFSASERQTFYGNIGIDFRIADAPQHYHVPLLLSPFGYATYRGS